ncbi:MAG: hypothetical protein EON54_00290 [Alcaligenaceae bacterium]|nr:MAG: hypothetical protein EON54_00290 [Alcaligenaceae bacterium]
MFKEFAVEPDAITGSYRDFAYVVEKFGVPEGRWISRFPKTWKALVYESAKAKLGGTKELTKIEERLRRIGDQILLASGRFPTDNKALWIESAVAEHKLRPFDAIVATLGRDDPNVVALADLDGDHPCLAPNRQWTVARTAQHMAACCMPLLVSSRHIKLVDPHFDLTALRFRRPLAEFLAGLRPGATVDLFRGDNLPPAFAIQQFGERLTGIHPKGVRVRLFLRPQAPMHNRFVLTERGGLTFLTGLDDANGGPKTHDEVIVLEGENWDSQWLLYSGDDAVHVWT